MDKISNLLIINLHDDVLLRLFNLKRIKIGYSAACMQHSGHNKKPLKKFIQVAVPAPLYSCFDYLSPKNADEKTLHPGCRVQVPFGRRFQIGVILGHSDTTEVPAGKLKAVQSTFDVEPVLPQELLKLLKWAASYYQYPIGEVVHTECRRCLEKASHLR